MLGQSTASTGFSDGVFGYAVSTSGGRGVVGYNSATAGTSVFGIWGQVDSPNGVAVYGTAPNNGVAGYFGGRVVVAGTLSKSAGSFKIDHPLDPARRYLVHAAIEGPEMMNVYSGNVTTDVRGEAWVELPEYFEALNRDYRYQLTAVGQFAQAIVGQKVRDNRFLIRTDRPGVEISWQVTGVRNDAFARRHPLEVEPAKVGPERGRYLNPELYDEPAELRMLDALLAAEPPAGE